MACYLTKVLFGSVIKSETLFNILLRIIEKNKSLPDHPVF